MTVNRRAFLFGATAALAAPAVVQAEALMKLWVPPKPVFVVPPTDSLFGAAGLLNAHEEGYWTPTLVWATPTTSFTTLKGEPMHYTKTGKTVFVSGIGLAT